MKVIPVLLAFAIGVSAASLMPSGESRKPAAVPAEVPVSTGEAISPGLTWAAAQLFAAGGNEFFQAGQYEYAIQKYTDALSIDAEMPEVYFLRGQSYWRTQRLDEAISDFSNAIEHEKGSQPVYYSSRCTAYILRQNWDAAIADCSDAIDLAPRDGGAYVLRGSAYFFKGNLENALADSLVALMIRPDDATAKRLLGLTVMTREAQIEERRQGPQIRMLPNGTGLAG